MRKNISINDLADKIFPENGAGKTVGRLQQAAKKQSCRFPSPRPMRSVAQLGARAT
jgi:hypothetical protein